MRGRRAALLTLAVVVVVLVAAEVAVRVVVDGPFLARKATAALGDRWHVEIADADASLLAARLRARGVCVERLGGITANVDHVTLTGVDPWAILVRGRVAARHLTIARAAVQMPPPDEEGGLAGIAVRADGVEFSAAALRDSTRTLGCRALDVTAPANRWRWGRYDWSTGALRFSTRDSTLAADAFAVATYLDDDVFARSHDFRATRYDVSFGSLRARYGGWRPAGGRPGFRLRAATLDDLQVDVACDMTVPARPDRPPARMPHEKLRALGFGVALDTLRIDGGAVRYHERSPAGGPFGVISFTDLAATITDLANDPALATGDRATSFAIRTRPWGAAPLHLHWEYDLLAEPLDVDAVGSLGPMPAAALDAALAPLEGIRFRAGTLDSLQFALHLGPAVATGRVGVRFHDLSVTAADEKPGLGPFHGLKILLSDLFVLNDAAAAGADTLQYAVADYRRLPHDSFFKYLWAALRSGLLTSLKS